MTDYEGMFIVKPDMDKDLKKKVLDAISAAITKEGGTITDFAEWGKNRLAYKMKRHAEGLYILSHFKLDPLKLDKVQKSYNLNENILKTLIILQADTVKAS